MRFSLSALVAAVAVLACGGDPPAAPTTGISLERVSGDAQSAMAATRLPGPVTIVVLDEEGVPMPRVTVSFSVVAGGGATTDTVLKTDAGGKVSTYWYLGPAPGIQNRLRATYGTFHTEFTATASQGNVGTSYFGDRSYIEYIPGNLPIVISIPHDGTMDAPDIPQRSWGTTGRDTNTDPLARAISDAFFSRTGKRPHLIFCRLRRGDMDANREIIEAAQGNKVAERVWYEYHAFINSAKSTVLTAYPTGFYMDLHGHGHAIARLELGYLLTGSELQLSDAQLNQESMINRTSLRTLLHATGVPLTEMLRGPRSLGTLFEERGYPAVPSGPQPHPAGNPYFNGGYNTVTHGSRNGGVISGFQLETHYTGVRNNATSRAQFAAALAEVFEIFLDEYMGLQLR